MEKINITLLENTTQPVVVHVLEGAAPKNSYPEKLDIKGDINAVVNFIATREETLVKNKCHIIFNQDSKTIVLVINEDSEYKGQVEAKLENFSDLAEFGINRNKFFTRADMEKLIRMNRFYFPDKDDHMKLMSDFKSFTARVQQEIQQSADQRGNKTNVNVKNVQSDLVESFVISIPIYKGGEPKTFRVEICYDVTDSAPRFWLESVELFELEKVELETKFNATREILIAKGFTTINA